MNLAMLLVATLLAQEPLPVVPVTITPGTRLVLQQNLKIKEYKRSIGVDGVTVTVHSTDDVDDVLNRSASGGLIKFVATGNVYTVLRIVNGSPDPNYFLMRLICRSSRDYIVSIEVPSIDTTAVDANAIASMFRVIPAVKLAKPDRSVFIPQETTTRPGGY